MIVQVVDRRKVYSNHQQTSSYYYIMQINLSKKAYFQSSTVFCFLEIVLEIVQHLIISRLRKFMILYSFTNCTFKSGYNTANIIQIYCLDQVKLIFQGLVSYTVDVILGRSYQYCRYLSQSFTNLDVNKDSKALSFYLI